MSNKKFYLRLAYGLTMIMINFFLIFLAAGEISKTWVIFETHPYTDIGGVVLVIIWLLTSIHIFKDLLWERY